MRVVYTSIVDHILKLQEYASDGGRELKYIALTKEEWDEVCDEVPSCLNESYRDDEVIGTLYDITIVGYKYHLNKMKEKKMKKFGL